MGIAQRGAAAITICSTAFVAMGRAQAGTLGFPMLPIAVVAHPFGLLTRDEIRATAENCVNDLVKLAAGGSAT